ncbi:MAG: hypothetical protein KatS3mg087_1201 [Patescibacteria group bacterium]|nr:MAG: hypothetical protein KatS3mg087_1201 [Patescibacteria group bacterium]
MAATKADKLKLRPKLNPMLLDPTRTFFQRRRLEALIGAVFKKINKEIKKLIVDLDAFGLKQQPITMASGSKKLVFNTIWRFRTDPEKIDEFTRWLRSVVDPLLLGPGTDTLSDEAWITRYIRTVFAEGIERAFAYFPAAPMETIPFFTGTKEDFLRASFAHPVARARFDLLASRMLTDLKGITGELETRLRRVLADGFARQESPWTIARNITREIGTIERTRAKTIARTEVIRAHNEGQLIGFEMLGVDKVGVLVEWRVSGLGVTARGNPSPCPICAPLNGIVLKISEAKGLLPRHPNCMCSWIPAGVGESDADQKTSFTSITKSIKESIKAETDPSGKLKVKDRLAKSKWLGAATSIAKNRPKRLI